MELSHLICQNTTACNCILCVYHSGSQIFPITGVLHHDKFCLWNLCQFPPSSAT